jgi:hypothetical protein
MTGDLLSVGSSSTITEPSSVVKTILIQLLLDVADAKVIAKGFHG